MFIINCLNILAYDITEVPIYYPGAANQVNNRPNATVIQPVTTQAPIVVTTPPTKPPTVAPSTTTSTTSTTITTTTTTTTTTERPQPIPDIEDKENEVESPITRKPEVERPINLPEDSRCKLPTNPNFDVDFSEAGYRFFSLREQRLELPSFNTKLRKQHDISLSFRTNETNGILFYAADKNQSDFIALYLSEGRVIHHVNLNAEAIIVNSTAEFNDGNWHTVKFIRNQRRISLLIDNEEQEPSYELEERNVHAINTVFPFYVGGIPKHIEENVYKNIDYGNTSKYFNGCLRDLKFLGKTLEQELQPILVVPCSDKVEKGLFFHKPTGFVKLFERFTVGTEFSISFDFRPREPDGLLFSVHGKSSYLILELVDNQLWFTVKSDAKNIVTTNYTLPDNGSFCDGKWRYVHAVKSKFVITISVDWVSANPGLGQEGSTYTKTNRPLFMGGHQAFNKAPGLKTRKTYKGCIRNVHVNKKPVRITSNLINGEIWKDVCPLN